MPRYTFTDPETSDTITLERATLPTEEELDTIFQTRRATRLGAALAPREISPATNAAALSPNLDVGEPISTPRDWSRTPVVQDVARGTRYALDVAGQIERNLAQKAAMGIQAFTWPNRAATQGVAWAGRNIALPLLHDYAGKAKLAAQLANLPQEYAAQKLAEGAIVPAWQFARSRVAPYIRPPPAERLPEMDVTQPSLPATGTMDTQGWTMPWTPPPLPTVTTQAEYDALDSGQRYLGADGRTYRKP